MSRFVQLVLVGLLVVTIAAIVWIVMLTKKNAKPAAEAVPITQGGGAGKAPNTQQTPPPQQGQRDPALDAKPELTAALYPKLAPIEKTQMMTAKVIPDAAKPVSAITFFQYTSRSASFADPSGKRVDHFIGGEVIRRCEVAGKGTASFGWFEMRPGLANQPPPGRDIAPQRVYVAMLPLANGQAVEFGYAAKRDDVERHFNEGWGCNGTPAQATKGTTK